MKLIYTFKCVQVEVIMSKKISQLPSASSLSGTEVVPVVQDGTTKKASVSLFGGGGSGDVSGPGSSTNNAIARFDGTDGSTIQNSGATVDDSGNVIATNISSGATVSGTNTGDQTISLTGDVTGSGTGSFAATIANDAVTYAKMQNVSATDKVLGRSSSGSGDVEEITCTAAGRALIDDADASAQRTTLGLGTLATQSGTFSGTSSGTNTGDQDLSGYVPTSRTINGYALSANVTLSKGDIGLGNVTDHVQTKASVVPNTLPSSGQVLVGNAGGTAYVPVSISGDGSLAANGSITVTKSSGVSFAASATTDTTNANNISSGVLASGRGGAGSVAGILKANGSGTVSAASAGTDYSALAFKTISVSGQSDVVADNAADTLTLVAGDNVTITTDASNDTITISATGGGGGGGSGWGLAGNSGLNPSNFLGTTDGVDVVVKANSVEAARFAHSNGYLGLGVSPSGKIHTYEATNSASTWIMQSLMGYGVSNTSQTISMRAISGNTEMGYIQLRSVDPADSGYPGTTALVFAARNSAALRALLTVDGHAEKVKVTDPADATRFGAFAMGTAFTISTSSGPIALTSPIVATGGSVQITSSTNPSSGVGLELHGFSDRGQILAYDRDASAYKQLRLDGLEIALYTSGSALASAAFLKTDASGVVSAGGYIPYDGDDLDADVAGLGYIKTVAAPDASYTPTTSGDWASTAPATVQQALDRIAAAVAGLLTTPIP